MRRKQVDMQQRLWAAKLICQMFRQESCHASTVKQSEERTRREETRSEPSWTPGGPSRGRLERQEVRPEAVLAAKRPVWRPSWPPGGPSGGRLERQEARPEAVLDARRPVRRPSWAPGGSSAGRLGRQEARMKFYCSFARKCRVLRRRKGWGSESGVQRPQGGR